MADTLLSLDESHRLSREAAPEPKKFKNPVAHRFLVYVVSGLLLVSFVLLAMITVSLFDSSYGFDVLPFFDKPGPTENLSL